MTTALSVIALGVACIALVVSLRPRPGAAPVAAPADPAYRDLSVAARAVELGRLGSARLVQPERGDLLPGGALRIELDRADAVLYDLWARTDAGWVQLYPTPDGRWRSHLLEGIPVSVLRLWIDAPGPDRQVDPTPARQAAAMLAQGTTLLSRRLAVAPETGEAALPTMVGWARQVRSEVLVGRLLEEWTEACVAASAIGWPLGIPAGDALLEAWSRMAAPSERPAEAFARWLVVEIGRASREGLSDRDTAERRDPVARAVHHAAAQLVSALDESLIVDASPPGGVGPRHRESWLADEVVAAALDNPAVGGVIQPVLVLRPQLRRADRVLVEGEVG